tara:strand:+ start:213 stop:527 length:315 start_codon:yes stop_codon:yes gene_type:complete
MAQEKAPGAIAKLVLGALSIAFCWTGIGGLVLGLIARGGPSTANLEEQNPGKYTAGSLKLHKIGRILGLVGWPLGILWIIGWIIYWIVIAYYVSSYSSPSYYGY